MKNFLSLIISLMPFSFLRIFGYRIFLGYQIDFKSSIGFFNVINGKNVVINNAKIGHFNYIMAETINLESAQINKLNRIKNLNILSLKEGSRIFNKNFIGGAAKNIDAKGFEFNQQNVIIGSDSAVNRSNYFDVVRSITIGDNVVFGGNGSEIWTHGFEQDRTMLTGAVTFGNDIFIGSKCTFTKSVEVRDGVTIGPASVIYKSINEKGIYSTHSIDKVK